MASSTLLFVPVLALLLLSVASTHCSASHVIPPGADSGMFDSRIRPSPTDLSASALSSAYAWQWSWGAPSANYFPWGSSSLYCTPVGACAGGACNSFYLQFDNDGIGFSYNYFGFAANMAEAKEAKNQEPEPEERGHDESAKKRADHDRKVVPGLN